MVKGARQREWPRHLSTHTHTHWTLPTTMSVLETPFDIHVSSVYQTHTCMQAPIPTLCISAKKTHNKGSRTRPIMSTLMPRSGIPVICSRATLSCDSSYSNVFSSDTTWPIKAKFYVEPSWKGGTKVCIKGPGHMTKMADMPIYGKNLKKFCPELVGRFPRNLVCSIGDSCPS